MRSTETAGSWRWCTLRRMQPLFLQDRVQIMERLAYREAQCPCGPAAVQSAPAARAGVTSAPLTISAGSEWRRGRQLRLRPQQPRLAAGSAAGITVIRA